MRSPDSTLAPSRLDALDRLRGIALVAMLLHHIVGWLTGGDAREVLPGWPTFAVTDVAAPAFFVAAGMSGAMLIASRRRRGLRPLAITGQVMRRYGLLVPLGMVLRWALGWSPFGFGVLEALGVTVLLAAAIAVVVPARLQLPAAVATLGAGMLVERSLADHDDWLSAEVMAGRFPAVTYVGFVLVGVALVSTGWYADRRWMTVGAVAGVAALVALLVDGLEPDRYPGDLRFVVPGLAGTAVVYALGQSRWPAWAEPFDQVVRRAAAHSLGIFLVHYAIFGLLDRVGVNGSVDAATALLVAALVTLVLCVAAPLVPQLPWSLRTGRRARPRRGSDVGDVGDGRGAEPEAIEIGLRAREPQPRFADH